MNSFWMPKRQPLYAPMLSTFGGGSARGFNPGGGGDVEIPLSATHLLGSQTYTGYAGSHRVTLIGGGGASGIVDENVLSGFGGRGGLVIFDVMLSQGDTISVYVGGKGSKPASSNVGGTGGAGGPSGNINGGSGAQGDGGNYGGGGGGGMSTFYLNGSPVAIAGGGGGAGGGDQTTDQNMKYGDQASGESDGFTGAAFGGDAGENGEHGQANNSGDIYLAWGGGKGTSNSHGTPITVSNASFVYSGTVGNGNYGNSGSSGGGGNGGTPNAGNAGGGGGGGSGYWSGAGGQGAQSGRTPSYAGAGGGGSNYLSGSVLSTVFNGYHNGYLGTYGLGGGWDVTSYANSASTANSGTTPKYTTYTQAVPTDGRDGYFKIEPNF